MSRRPAIVAAPLSLLCQNLVSAIIARRLRLGWTQQDLARAAGVKQQRISVIERHRQSPSIATLVRIARVLGLAVRIVEVIPEHEIAGSLSKLGPRANQPGIVHRNIAGRQAA